ncbi:uncharacterized protein LOC143351912 [Colletes latitarsis]|uniref:uncharacterized protein LOC143351912 n=1 Tax=Colletes latitarsis TaxID=2605962 RepID=UPI004035B270
MVDSDADSWYNWKQDDFNKSHRGRRVNATNDARLTGSSYLNRLTSDDSQKGSSRSNGLIFNSAVPTSSRSDAEIRFINPAIYAETLNNGNDDREIQIRVKVSSKDSGPIEGNCGDFTGKSDVGSTLSIKNDLSTSFVDHAGDQASAQETYRCYSLNSPTTSLESGVPRSKSVTSCRPSNQVVERRCRIGVRADERDEVCSVNRVDTEEQRYSFNGHRIVQVSTTSLSSISISENRLTESDLLKRIPYHEWMRKKQQAARQKKEEEDQAERKKQIEAERLAREKEERESQERENFLKWSEKKRREEERKKAMVEKELDLQRQLKEIEEKAVVAKSLYLRQWARKKKEEEKARQKKEEMKRQQLAEEKKKRLEESTKAYENWRKNAKNKPKPATQGLLPHQKAKPAYVNPMPWQPIINDTEDSEENPSNVRKTQCQPKISSKRCTTPYQ